MHAALFNNASPPAMLMDKSREMDAVAAERKKLAICPTDDDAIALKSKKPHKQSFDYIWRTGLAGGLAGSAVRPLLHYLVTSTDNMDRQKQ
jgi:solute carrier family 25 protein 16